MIPERARPVRRVHLHAALQSAEAGRRAVEGDDLAVEHERGAAGLVSGEGVGDLWVGGGEVLAAARAQAHAVVGAEREDPLAVELPLEDPTVVAEVVLGQGGEHRLDPARLVRGVALLPIRALQHVERAHRCGAPSSFRATWSRSRPVRTDSGCVLVGFRRASAPSSSSFTSSHAVVTVEAGQRVAAPQLAALQPHRDVSVVEAVGEGHRRAVVVGGEVAVRAGVPHDHRAGAVGAFGDDALEVEVVDRVVLDLAARAACRGVGRGAPRGRPRTAGRRRPRGGSPSAWCWRRAAG